jgi:transcriptional regulator with XRE-family HTH domain
MTKRIRSVPMVFNRARFGNDILAMRWELGLSQRAVGEMCELEGSLLSRYERGDETNMKMQNFLAICNVYDIDPREYFELER